MLFNRLHYRRSISRGLLTINNWKHTSLQTTLGRPTFNMNSLCRPNILLYIFCFGAFCSQVYHLCQQYVQPVSTTTNKLLKNLKDVEFPAVFKICVYPPLRTKALKSLGYEDSFDYFNGDNRFNKSIKGWAGHLQDGGSYGNVTEVYNKIFSINNFLVINYNAKSCDWSKLLLREDFKKNPRKFSELGQKGG